MNLLINKIERLIFPCSHKIQDAFHLHELSKNALKKTLEKAKEQAANIGKI